MIDFGSVMKIKNAWDTFNRNHPKFMPFCQAVGRDGIGVDTIIEVKVTSADGREYNTNMKLTQSDVEKIKEEIEHRKLVVRPEAIEAVKEARAQGDLSENFEYYAAKKEKNRNDGRIRYLEKMLKYATIVDDTSKDDEVGMNNTVDVYFEDDDETETYKLVTSIRGDSMHNYISIESPIGKAIMGHKVGDRVQVVVNDNVSYYVRIKKIDKTTDDSNDRIKEF